MRQKWPISPACHSSITGQCKTLILELLIYSGLLICLPTLYCRRGERDQLSKSEFSFCGKLINWKELTKAPLNILHYPGIITATHLQWMQNVIQAYNNVIMETAWMGRGKKTNSLGDKWLYSYPVMVNSVPFKICRMSSMDSMNSSDYYCYEH